MRSIASLAVEAALHEAAAGPKPGLVDRFNSGAHSDMDLFTFASSASVLYPFFDEMVQKGRDFAKEDLTLLLREIRPVGIAAEQAMLDATEGINTHKGLIFSLGILCASAGYLQKTNDSAPLLSDDLCLTAGKICSGIVKRELEEKEDPGTNGEKLYKTLKVSGIRGEAQAGFPSVRQWGLPSLLKSEGDWNTRLIDTLLNLMTVVEDSNVLARSGVESLERMKRQAAEALEAGGASTPEGMEILAQMDMDFTERNISPGGCADLLALSIFLYQLTTLKKHAPFSTAQNRN